MPVNLSKTYTMNNSIYTQIIKEVKKNVSKATDEQLNAQLYVEELEAKYRIEPLYLDKDNLVVEIKSKTLTANNAPEGFTYTKGDVVNYAHYSMPVKGDVSLFKTKIEDLLKASNKFYLVKGFLFIEEYYFEKIVDNDAAIEALKLKVVNDIRFIEQYMVATNVEIEQFNATLKNEIHAEIAAELDRRRIENATLHKLNPFK